MAHYAFLDENNIVTEVIVGVDETDLIEGVTAEEWYGNFRKQVCKRTSYNTLRNKHLNQGVAFRGNYAGIGYIYDSNLDIFIPPKPYDSWVIDQNICDWVAPISKPEDVEGFYWQWIEENQEWTQVAILN